MSERDDFSAKAKLDLAMRAGYKCAFPTCRATTIGPSDEGPAKHSNVGVACHITAAAEGGRRYDPLLTPEQRADINNGIWMCATHSVEIDRDEARYTVAVLHAWKADAEAQARAELGRPAGAAAASVADAHFARGLWYTLQPLRWTLFNLLWRAPSTAQRERVEALCDGLRRGIPGDGRFWAPQIIDALETVITGSSSAGRADDSPLALLARAATSIEEQAATLVRNASPTTSTELVQHAQRLQLHAATARAALPAWRRASSASLLLSRGRGDAHAHGLVLLLEAMHRTWQACSERNVIE